jgi:chaperonin GroEL
MVRETSTIFGKEVVEEKLKAGAIKIASVVGSTLGPYGTNVALTKVFNVPHITKDGVTVAHGVNLEDPIENVASETIKNAAKQTANVAGDGTSSTTIFAAKLFKEILEATSGMKISDIKSAIEKHRDIAINIVNDIKTEIASSEDVYNIAKVASNNDDNISQLVTDAFDKIGKHGVITVTESKSYKTFIDTTDGIKLDRSHIATSLIEKNKEEYDAPRILVTNFKFSNQKDGLALVNLQEACNSPLLVICEDLEKEALEIVTYNKRIQKLPILVIRNPFIAEARKEASKDLAIATGATFIEKEAGWAITDFNPGILGSADKAVVTLKETNIIGRKGNPEVIAERVAFYEQKIKEDYEGLSENYKKRLAYFNGGAAVIYVGGSNEIEVQELKDRLDDTIKAVKAAFEDGYVSGAGQTYFEIVKHFKDTKNTLSNCFCKALLEIPATLVNNKLQTTREEFSFTTYEEFLEEEVSSNVIDPASVITNVIRNGVAAALMLTSTKMVIVKKEE